MMEMLKILLVSLAVLCLSYKVQASNNETDIQPAELYSPFTRYVMYVAGKREKGDKLVYSYGIEKETFAYKGTPIKRITYVEAVLDGNGEHDLIITNGGIGQKYISVDTRDTTENQIIYIDIYGV